MPGFHCSVTQAASERWPPPRKRKGASQGAVVEWGTARELLEEEFHPAHLHGPREEASGLQGVKTMKSNHVRVSTRPQVQCCPSGHDLLPEMGTATGFLKTPLPFHSLLHATGSHTKPKREPVAVTKDGVPRRSHSPEESRPGRSTRCSGRGCPCYPGPPASGSPGTRSHLKRG